MPDTFRQTERKGSAMPTGDERSLPASEGGFALHANPCKGAYAPALLYDSFNHTLAVAAVRATGVRGVSNPPVVARNIPLCKQMMV